MVSGENEANGSHVGGKQMITQEKLLRATSRQTDIAIDDILYCDQIVFDPVAS